MAASALVICSSSFLMHFACRFFFRDTGIGGFLVHVDVTFFVAVCFVVWPQKCLGFPVWVVALLLLGMLAIGVD